MKTGIHIEGVSPERTKAIADGILDILRVSFDSHADQKTTRAALRALQDGFAYKFQSTKNFGTDDEEPIKEVSVDGTRKLIGEGHFKAGSMGPKMEAALGFVVSGGDHAIITSLDKAVDALMGKTGTHIVPN